MTYGMLDLLLGGSGRRGGSSGSGVPSCAVGDTDSRTPVETERVHSTQGLSLTSLSWGPVPAGAWAVRLEVPSFAHSARWVSRCCRPLQHACELCSTPRAHQCPSQPHSWVDTPERWKPGDPQEFCTNVCTELVQQWERSRPHSGEGETLKTLHLGGGRRVGVGETTSHRRSHSAWLPFLQVFHPRQSLDIPLRIRSR